MADGGAQPGELERAVDALYAADPDGFIAARKLLADELRRAGRRDEARQVAGLRRPKLAAWAVDQLALRAPERVDALLAAGERLRRAHEEVVGGGDRGVLQRAAAERRALIAALVDEALEVLARRGGASPEPHREEIEATLEAASSDAGVAALVRRGRLTDAVPRPAGFGGLLDLPLPSPPAEEPPARSQAAEGHEASRDEESLERAREEAARLEQLAAEAEAQAEAARSAVEQALAAVVRLEGELTEARARAEAAEDEARHVAARAEEARRAASAAAERLAGGDGRE